ncbi:hypothetical protein [Leucothrix pacifica]|uniref:Uncharacterized protein n=1 Tax=Leucothrix pacifica TaxID=1247513 RepID=A0A317C5G2_9GAMM|nr:hypothetical protein [Leucothrix pacifica]PWQ92603.1 hypothetical protein DKW60_20305 [Leucothrix pacifica]
MSKVRFNRRPMPLIAEYRPIYKIFQILSILEYSSRGGKSSLIRLHLINWVLKTESRKEELATLAADANIPFKVWGVDPILNVALQFSVAQKLITQKSDAYSITFEGKKLLKLAKEQDIELRDSSYLGRLGKRITEKMVEEIVNKWN